MYVTASFATTVIVVSSAYCITVLFWIVLGRAFTYSKNRRGPSMEL